MSIEEYIETRIDCELDEERLKGLVRMWAFYEEEGMIDSTISAVIGTIFGGSSTYLNLMYFQSEIPDSSLDMFNEKFQEKILDKKDQLRKIIEDVKNE